MFLPRGSSRSQTTHQTDYPPSSVASPPLMSRYPAVHGAPQWNYQQQNPNGWQGQYAYAPSYNHVKAPAPIPAYTPSQRAVVVVPPPSATPHYPRTQVHAPVPSYSNQLQTQSDPAQIQAQRKNSSRRPPTPGIALLKRSSTSVNRVVEEEESDDEDDVVVLQRQPQMKSTPAPAPSQRIPPPQQGQAHSSQKPPLNPVSNLFWLLPDLAPNANYPRIEWNITYPCHKAVKRMKNGGETPLDMEQKAITPALDYFYVTTLNMSSPLQDVIDRWGPVLVRSKRRDPMNPYTFGFILHDVLQGIHQYFNKRLSDTEIRDLDDKTRLGVVRSLSNRWKAAQKPVWDEETLENAQKPIRADFLQGYIHYAGLKMLPNFHETKTLYLTLERPALGRE